MKSGILLVNLGTPSAPTAAAIREWLGAFLSDPRVVELPRVLWLPILYGIILPLRPVKLVPAYQSIWTDGGSPLMVISRQQRTALQQLLGDTPVALAMRYGEPTVASGIAELQQRGAQRIVVLPLYPQYSATTTATVFDDVFAQLRKLRDVPEVLTVHDYHAHPAYIAALENSVRRHWEAKGRGDHLMLSFHGLPQKCVDKGDPYQAQCKVTSRLLAEALQLRDDEWTLCYQSRVGKAKWLQPYTEDALVTLAQRGIKQLDAICPGFSADCLETLEEVSERYGEQFHEAGGEALRYIPALNAHPDHIEVLRAVLAQAGLN